MRNFVCDAVLLGFFYIFVFSSTVSSKNDLDLITRNILEHSTEIITIHNNTDLDIIKIPKIGKNKFRNRKRTKTRLSARRNIGTPELKTKRINFLKKKRILRRRKLKQRRRKQKNNSNIFEITTSKGIILSRTNQSDETINKLIEKLNKNPEDNFDEFKNKKPIEDEDFYNNTHTKLKINNRCNRKRGGCSHICHPKGQLKCSCLTGFILGNDQKSCHDINECNFNNGQCETECVNLVGSYVCKCPEGLALTDDKLSCRDVNECLLRNGHGPCQDTCQNTFGSYTCNCDALNGTKLDSDGHTCQDIDECLTNNGGCSHICINTLGRSFCSCPSGMELSSDWKTCQDVNECESESIKKSCKNCLNTQGSYICLDVSDMQNDQSSANVACKPLFPPSRGFIRCTREGAFQSITKKGRKRTINSPGTICELVCPVEYRIVGEYYISCGVDGEWRGKNGAKCIAAPPPTLQCPPNQHVALQNGAKRVSVKFSSPVTDVHWDFVKSKPRWAKNLEGNLTGGQYDVTFTVKDPKTRLFSTCSFKIFVEANLL